MSIVDPCSLTVIPERWLSILYTTRKVMMKLNEQIVLRIGTGRGQEDAAAKLFKLSQPCFHLNGHLPVDRRVP